MVDDVLAVAEDWARAAQLAKGISDGTPPNRNEDYLSGPITIARNLRLLGALAACAARDRARPASANRGRWPTGQIAVVGGAGLAARQRALRRLHRRGGHAARRDRGQPRPSTSPSAYGDDAKASAGAGVRGARRRQRLVDRPDGRAAQALRRRRGRRAEDEPVNDYTGPFVEQAFAALVERGVLRVVYGGVEVGRRVTTHDLIDSLHLTGSDKTYDAVVFGTGDQGARRRAADEPINTKDFTAELGNVTPVIVVPGRWSNKDIRFQAMNIASMLANNAGFNCIAARRGRDATSTGSSATVLMTEIAGALKRIEQRHPYYPGARQRYERFVSAHPDAWVLQRDATGRGALSRSSATSTPPADRDDIAFTTEAFCGSSVRPPSTRRADVGAFLRQASCSATRRCGASSGRRSSSTRGPRRRTATPSRRRCSTCATAPWRSTTSARSPTRWSPRRGGRSLATTAPTSVPVPAGVHNTALLDGVEKSIVARAPSGCRSSRRGSRTTATSSELAPLVARLEGRGDLTVVPKLLLTAARG